MTTLSPLPPVERFAGDDWAGTWAFVFTVWQTPPVLASDGITITTPGVPVDITGWTPSGTLYGRADLARLPIGAPAILGIPLAGTLTDPVNGEFELTLDRTRTGFQVQDPHAPVPALELRARITDLAGNLGTAGVLPIFVR